MKTHRFAGRRRLASRGAALILAFGLPLAALEGCSDGDSSKASESKASHAGKGRQSGKGRSEGGDSSGENESSPGGAASNGDQTSGKGVGATASDGSSGGVSATPTQGPSAGGGPTPGGGKAGGTGAPSLNSPSKMKGWKAGQANSGKILSKSKKGCFLSAGRQQIEGAQGGDRKMTEDASNHHLAELQQGKSNFHTEPSGRTKLRGANGAEVDGVANVVTYADAGGKNYRGWHWFRAFSTATPAVYVQVSYTCPASAYSESELTKIVEKSGLSVDGDVPGGIVN